MKSIVSWLRRRGKSQTPATKGATDGLSRLPLELHFFVLEHLELEDLAAALNVCRSWRYIWLSDEVWPSLASRWLPGLSEQVNLTAATIERRGEIFRQALVKHQIRSHGLFSNAIQHSMTLESDRLFKLGKDVSVDEGGIHVYTDVREWEPGLDRFARFRLYNNGRIAWWPEPYALPYIAVVDDLRSRTRRVFSFPNHHGEQVGYQTAMGDKLFIMGKERILHAWHLENGSHQCIELPYDFKRCITERETVLIIAKDSTIYLWKFGLDFQQVDMSSIYEKAAITWGDQGDFVPSVLGPHRVGLWLRWANIALDFIVHPDIEDAFFVVTLRGGVLSVHEIVAGNSLGSYTLDEGLLSRRALEASGQLRWEKVDSIGGYNLLSIYPMPRGSPTEDQDNDEICREISCRCQTWWSVGGHTLVTVCFNIYTKSFDVLRHQPLSYYQPRTFHIWNRHLLAAGRGRYPNGWHVASFKKSTGWTNAQSIASVPLYSISKTKLSGSSVLSRRRMTFDELEINDVDTRVKVPYNLGYILDARQPGSHNDQTPRTQENLNNIRLVGDDDYLIMFEEGSYMAWCFGNRNMR